jgi:hypothetical protein
MLSSWAVLDWASRQVLAHWVSITLVLQRAPAAPEPRRAYAGRGLLQLAAAEAGRSTWAQPKRYRRLGAGLSFKKFKPQPIHLCQDAACSNERSRLSSISLLGVQMYYIVLPDLETGRALITALKRSGVYEDIHYGPLDSAPTGFKLGRAHGELTITDSIADRLFRLLLQLAFEEYLAKTVHRIMSAIG